MFAHPTFAPRSLNARKTLLNTINPSLLLISVQTVFLFPRTGLPRCVSKQRGTIGTILLQPSNFLFFRQVRN
ncbi:hypothetical protein L596_028532 [Steinernema carpocapsae]|uniref:Uncharacterized protein n=1 Tax=Steinernema carpocapsae TaxID=34508 RepID=A0A4V5ZXX3_STECR|nr:hypothetical protein L596_028532 [Steinernema carpocapsae]